MDSLELTYSNTVDDLVVLGLRYKRQNKALKVLRILLSLIGVCLLGLSFYGVYQAEKFRLKDLNYILMGLIFSLAYAKDFFNLDPWIYRRYYKKLKTKPSAAPYFDKKTIRISEKGIHQEIGDLKGERPWSSIESIEETDKYIFLVNQVLGSFVIPKSCFSELSFSSDDFVARAQFFKRQIGLS